MDLRIKRTERSIRNAFLELRARKDIERISVLELSELALINKATFYQHYRSIYDLSEKVEHEAVRKILEEVNAPEEVITETSRVSQEIRNAAKGHIGELEVIFSGSRKAHIADTLEDELKKAILIKHPEYRKDLYFDLLLTLLVQGNFIASMRYGGDDDPKVRAILNDISEKAVHACMGK